MMIAYVKAIRDLVSNIQNLFPLSSDAHLYNAVSNLSIRHIQKLDSSLYFFKRKADILSIRIQA